MHFLSTSDFQGLMLGRPGVLLVSAPAVPHCVPEAQQTEMILPYSCSSLSIWVLPSTCKFVTAMHCGVDVVGSDCVFCCGLKG